MHSIISDVSVCHALEFLLFTLQWHHSGRDGVSNPQPPHCLLNHSFWHRSKKTSKLCVTGLWAGNSPVTGEFPAQMASNSENVSIWWRHHDFQNPPVPWVSILTSMSFWAMATAHFTYNWGFYTLLTALPKYMDEVLHYDLSEVNTGEVLHYVSRTGVTK